MFDDDDKPEAPREIPAFPDDRREKSEDGMLDVN